MAGREIEHTTAGDVFPQFTHHRKSDYHCEICVPYQRWAKENGRKHSALKSKLVKIDDIMNGTAVLIFSGVVQAREHFSSKVHQEAIDFFKSDATEKATKVNEGKPARKEAVITNFFCTKEAFKLTTTSGPTKEENSPRTVRCLYYWDPEVVKYFEKDNQIRRTTSKSLFKRRLYEGIIRCYKVSMNHKQCYMYEEWKKHHPGEHRLLVEDASKQPKSVFIPLNKTIRVYGKDVTVAGGIKNLDPPCLDEAVSHGKHPFTCSNCAKQERELKNTLQHRRSGSLQDTKNRIGLSGFNKRYARKGELEDALEKAENRHRSAQKQIREMAKVQLAPKEIEDCLLDSSISGDEQKLVIDLVRLLKSDMAKKLLAFSGSFWTSKGINGITPWL